MLIGAHVSPAGGLPKAIERGVERGCRAIQIFNQSPRMWKASLYRDEDVAAFREAMAASPIDAVLIHTIYLLNCASEDRTIRSKSRSSLIHSLRAGAQIGASGVVLHPGSAKTGVTAAAIARAGATIREALAESEQCPLHLENTAGAGGTLGRSFEELAALIEACGGEERIGLCLDSCHLFATGYDVRSPEGIDATVEQLAASVGLERLGSLHLNDSQAPLGSNRDRHANVGQGELGEDGCAAFLASPAFAGLPCVLETNGPGRGGASAEEVALAVELRERGLAARASRPRSPSRRRQKPAKRSTRGARR
jgi:deoxyribonuclease IV